jgi:hypothetical protein
MLKALAQQEKQATRLRQREANAGPRDDLDIEWDALLAAQRQQYPPPRSAPPPAFETFAVVYQVHEAVQTLKQY